MEQQHYAGARTQEANIRDLNIKPQVVKVWADFQLIIVYSAIDQWRKRPQACVKTKGQHVEQLL